MGQRLLEPVRVQHRVRDQLSQVRDHQQPDRPGDSTVLSVAVHAGTRRLGADDLGGEVAGVIAGCVAEREAVSKHQPVALLHDEADLGVCVVVPKRQAPEVCLAKFFARFGEVLPSATHQHRDADDGVVGVLLVLRAVGHLAELLQLRFGLRVLFGTQQPEDVKPGSFESTRGHLLIDC